MGFLRPVPMAKVGLVGLKDDRETVVGLLHDLAVVQVEPLRKEASALLETEATGETQRKVAEELLRFRTLKNALPATEVREARAFSNLEEVLTAARGVSIDREVTDLKREEDALVTERRELEGVATLLSDHRYYRDPLGLLQSRRLLAFFGEATPDAFGQLEVEVRRIAETAFVASPEPKRVRFLLAVPREAADAIGRLAQQAGVRMAAVPDLAGTIDEEIPRLRDRVARADARLGEIRARLGELARQWYPTVAQLEEALAIENRKLEAWGRMGAGRASFTVEGWIPERNLPALESGLHARTGDRTHLYRIATNEEPPTLMDNPPGVRWFEFFIRFYSLPKSTEFDPTWIFAIAFPIFYGFMLGDVGYGVTILAISLWMIAGFPGGGKLPKGLRGFLTLIMGPAGMQKLARTLVPGCLLAIGLGIVYNEYFGFRLPFYAPIFDPVTGVGKLLLAAGYIGLAMVTLGFALGAVKAYYLHHPRDLRFRIGGILFAWGIADVGLLVIHKSLVLASPAAIIGIVLLALGAVLIVVGEGAMGALAFSEVVSHILSYTRLVGILLASVILAFVINTIFWGALHNPTSSVGVHIALIIGGVVILFVGQTFNLVLGVFEPGIQGLRLIFVEHFSKYFEGNGRPYQPFRSERRFTRPAPHDPAAPVGAGPAPSPVSAPSA
ncbi:MAG TPA: V-type ATP synthase subunit I [Thermoplasmata archaeon]|nr:V-type ATP synthase subunit I [Thermoplasmata archaeon]